MIKIGKGSRHRNNREGLTATPVSSGKVKAKILKGKRRTAGLSEDEIADLHRRAKNQTLTEPQRVLYSHLVRQINRGKLSAPKAMELQTAIVPKTKAV